MAVVRRHEDKLVVLMRLFASTGCTPKTSDPVHSAAFGVDVTVRCDPRLPKRGDY